MTDYLQPGLYWNAYLQSRDNNQCERSILSVLAQFPEGCEASKLTLLAGYRYSGGFRNSLGALRTTGYIVGENTGTMRAHDDLL